MILPNILKRQTTSIQSDWKMMANDFQQHPGTIEIDAAVLVVLDQWLMFSNDADVFEWALPIIQTKWAQAELAPHASVDAIVGHKGNKDQTQVSMVELLHLMLKKAGMAPRDYQCTFFEVTGQKTELRIWCVIAQRQRLGDFDA